MAYIPSLSELTGNKLSPEEFGQYREKLWQAVAAKPEFKELSRGEQHYIFRKIMEPEKPLLTMPRKGWFHPAVATPVRAAHRFVAGFDPTGLYQAAAQPDITKMTPAQQRVETAMWERLGPQSRLGRAAIDIGGTVAGLGTSVAAGPYRLLGKGVGAAQKAIAPTLAKRAADFGRAALIPKEAAALTGIEAAGWATGIGFFEGLRGLGAGMSPKEAAIRGAKWGGIVAGATAGMGALAYDLARIGKVPEARRLAALMAERKIQPAEVRQIAIQRAATAPDKATRWAWERLDIGVEQYTRDMAARQAAQQAGELGIKTAGVYQPPRPALSMPPSVAKIRIAGKYCAVDAPTVAPAKIAQIEKASAVLAGETIAPPQAAAKISQTAVKSAVRESLMRDTTVGAASRDYFKSFGTYMDWLDRQGLDQKRLISLYIQQSHNLELKGNVLGRGLWDKGTAVFGKEVNEQRMLDIYNSVIQAPDDVARQAAVARLKVTKPELDFLYGKGRVWMDKTYDQIQRLKPETGLGFAKRTDAAGREIPYWPRATKAPAGMSSTEYATKNQAFQQAWTRRSEAVTATRGVSPMFKRRKIDDWFEWAQAVRKAGLEPIVHPGEALDAYMRRTYRILGWRKLLHKMGGLQDDLGQDMIQVGRTPAVTADWVALTHPEFSRFAHIFAGKGFWAKAYAQAAKGKPALGGQPTIYAHPKIGNVINSLFAAPQATDFRQGLRQALVMYKQLLFWNPAIHGKNLFSDFLDECNFNIFKVVKQYRHGAQMWHSMDDALERALDAGLEVSGGSILAAMDINAVPGALGKALKPLQAAARWNQNLMFGKAIRYAQLATWEMKATHLLNKFPAMPQRAVEAAAAHFTNDLYGTLPKNWFNLTAGAAGNWTFLARNWTLSNLDLVAKAALKRGLGSATIAPAQMAAIQGEYVKHLMKGVVGLFVQAELLTYGATSIFGKEGGKHVWEFPMDEIFDIHTGAKDSRGREIKFSMPLFAYIRDIISWTPFPHPLSIEAFPAGKTFYNKVHPAWKVPMEALVNYSPWQRKSIATPGAPAGVQLAERAKYFVEGIVPVYRPIAHVITGKPQPGVKEPRMFPILAYLTGGYLKHGWRGAEHAKLVDDIARFGREETYARRKLRDKFENLLAAGDYEQARQFAFSQGLYKTPSGFRDAVFRYLAPVTARWQNLTRAAQREWQAQATPEQKKELVKALTGEREEVQVLFFTDARKHKGEEMPTGRIEF